MPTQNSWNSQSPVQVLAGGTGQSSFTDGQLLIGNSTGNTLTKASLTQGSNITITPGAGSITISASMSGGGLTWNTVAGTTQAAAVNNGYVCTNAARTTVTLPATAAVGSVIAVTGDSSGGGWVLNCSAGQNIILDLTNTSIGLASDRPSDYLEVVCTVANTTFVGRNITGNVATLGYAQTLSGGYGYSAYLSTQGLVNTFCRDTVEGGAGTIFGANQILADSTLWNLPILFQNLLGTIHSGGSAHQLLLSRLGQVWSWGNNDWGQLGVSANAFAFMDRSFPVPIVMRSSFKQICAGAASSYLLDNNGQIWACGRNNYGQLGTQNTTSYSSPVAVVGGHVFTTLANSAGYSFAALKSDGSAWCWGRNNGGQLGDESVSNRSSPVSVVGGHSFIKISSSYHTLGLKSDGSVWAWGGNSNGELGDQSTTNKSSPISVVGGHSFIDINAYYGHSAGLKADGSVWTWGNNANGQLGDQTTDSKSSPVSVVGAIPFIAIMHSNGIDIAEGATTTHMGAIKNDYSVWCWGSNGSGEVGDGTATDRSSPVLILYGNVRT